MVAPVTVNHRSYRYYSINEMGGRRSSPDYQSRSRNFVPIEETVGVAMARINICSSILEYAVTHP